MELVNACSGKVKGAATNFHCSTPSLHVISPSKLVRKLKRFSNKSQSRPFLEDYTTTGTPIKEGYLKKLSNNKVHKRLQKRYFVLDTAGTMYWFKSQDDFIHGVAPLNLCTMVNMLTIHGTIEADDLKVAVKHARLMFNIETGSKTYTLMGLKEKDKTEWMDVLNQKRKEIWQKEIEASEKEKIDLFEDSEERRKQSFLPEEEAIGIAPPQVQQTVDKSVVVESQPQIAEPIKKDVKLEGWLEKRNPKYMWQWRYAVLENGVMYYYTKEDKKKLRGEILLSSVEDVLVRFTPGPMDRRKYIFDIVCDHGRVYKWNAPSLAKRGYWLEGISAARGAPTRSAEEKERELEILEQGKRQVEEAEENPSVVIDLDWRNEDLVQPGQEALLAEMTRRERLKAELDAMPPVQRMLLLSKLAWIRWIGRLKRLMIKVGASLKQSGARCFARKV